MDWLVPGGECTCCMYVQTNLFTSPCWCSPALSSSAAVFMCLFLHSPLSLQPPTHQCHTHYYTATTPTTAPLPHSLLHHYHTHYSTTTTSTTPPLLHHYHTHYHTHHNTTTTLTTAPLSHSLLHHYHTHYCTITTLTTTPLPHTLLHHYHTHTTTPLPHSLLHHYHAHSLFNTHTILTQMACHGHLRLAVAGFVISTSSTVHKRTTTAATTWLETS